MTSQSVGVPPQRIFAALADATRCELLELLGGGAASASRLSPPLGISRQAVAKHLGVLNAAGLVRQRREGREIVFEVLPQGLSPANEYIQGVRDCWEKRQAGQESTPAAKTPLPLQARNR